MAWSRDDSVIGPFTFDKQLVWFQLNDKLLTDKYPDINFKGIWGIIKKKYGLMSYIHIMTMVKLKYYIDIETSIQENILQIWNILFPGDYESYDEPAHPEVAAPDNALIEINPVTVTLHY